MNPLPTPLPAAAESVQATTESTQQNIRAIAKLEQETMERRTTSERIGDAFTRVMGSLGFVIAHAIGFAVWFSINLGLIPGVKPFDPFPFGILTLIVSAEGVFLAIFVLLSQNRMSRLSSQRAHLNLQISLLAEQETTKLLQDVHRIAEHLGIHESEQDRVVERLSQETHLETLAEELKKTLPEE